MEIQKMTIPMGYYFKGSSNTYVYLEYNGEILTVKTDFGETIAVLTSANGLGKVLSDLENNGYA